MKFEIKSIYLMSTLLVLLLGVKTIYSFGDIISTSETPISFEQGYDHSADLKCLPNYEYNILLEAFIETTVKEIQLNHSSKAMERLNKISPDDDRFVQDIVTETMKQTDVKWLYLLEFINQTKLVTTKLNGFLDILSKLNHVNYTKKEDSSGNLRHIVNWLDFEHFVRYFVEHANDNESSTETVKLLSDVQDKAKSVVLFVSNGTFIGYDVKFGSEHISFIIKTLYNNNPNVKDLVRFLEHMYRFSYQRTECVSIISIIGLYDLIENGVNPNDTLQLIPAIKFVSMNDRQRNYECLEKLKFKGGSLFEKILSDKYFHFKNVYNSEYLYVKPKKRVVYKGLNNFIIKTVSSADSEKISWKFSAYEHSSTNRMLLTILNENTERRTLRVLSCLVHDDESIVQMEDSDSYSDSYTIGDGWNIEADDVTSDRFRIRNLLTSGYLAVRMNINNNQSNVGLVHELNAENFDSVHWTLEAIDEE